MIVPVAPGIGRMLREGKATITAEVTELLARFHSSADDWP